MALDQQFRELLERAQLDHYEMLSEISAEALMRKLDDLNREHQIIENLPRKGYFRRLLNSATIRGAGPVLAVDLPGDEDFPRPRPKGKKQRT